MAVILVGTLTTKPLIQWRPLNVITVNVIIRLILSVFQCPSPMIQSTVKKSFYCDQMLLKIRLLLSVFHLIHQNIDILVVNLLKYMINLYKLAWMLEFPNYLVIYFFN